MSVTMFRTGSPHPSLGQPAATAVAVSPLLRVGGRLEILDLLRGIAAIAVLIYHSDIYLGGQSLPNAYLAVDLFFLLSGFVIAHNYDSRIAAGMTLKEFGVQRLIRLYPTFLLGLTLGVVLSSVRMIREAGYIDGWRLIAAGVLNAFFIPTFVHPYGLKQIYPFNTVLWSLLFEVIANVLYHLIHKHLTAVRLALVIGLSGVGLFVVILALGHANVGTRSSDLVLGVPRVMFSFFMGVALRRHFYGHLRFRVRSVGVMCAVLGLLLAFASGRFVSAEHHAIAESLAVFVLFPSIVLLGTQAMPGARTRALSRWAGNASYPVYLLQMPFIALFAGVPQLFGVRAAAWVPAIGIVLVVWTIACALWVDRYYDLPVRQVLKTLWNRRLTSTCGAYSRVDNG